MGQDDSISADGSSRQDDMIGRVIAGKYKITGLLGRGGMGTVYQGSQLLLDRAVAIKLMHIQVAQDEAAAARFLREAQAAGRIDHPHAITIHDFGILEDKIAFIVMEHIRGASLRAWLRQYITVEPEQAVEWLVQAAVAVAAAHEQGVVHRDLKPENIMLKESADGRLTVKIVDFGLARLVENSSTSLTQTGEVMGTPHYMPPEAFEGERVDHRADIYALGIIAYEMLTGDTPFTGNMQTIISGHLFHQAPLPHTIKAGIPEPLSEAIARAISKKPEMRYDSAGDFAAALKEAVNNRQLAEIGAAAITIDEEVTSDQAVVTTTRYATRNTQDLNNAGETPQLYVTSVEAQPLFENNDIAAASFTVAVGMPAYGSQEATAAEDNQFNSAEVPGSPLKYVLFAATAIIAVLIGGLVFNSWRDRPEAPLPSRPEQAPISSAAEIKPNGDNLTQPAVQPASEPEHSELSVDALPSVAPVNVTGGLPAKSMNKRKPAIGKPAIGKQETAAPITAETRNSSTSVSPTSTASGSVPVIPPESAGAPAQPVALAEVKSDDRDEKRSATSNDDKGKEREKKKRSWFRKLIPFK